MKVVNHMKKYNSIEEWRAEAVKRFGDDPKNWKFVCPACKTEQTIQDFIDMGFTEDQWHGYIGYSCIGRFNNKEKGCDWTLGGLFQIHTVEIKIGNDVAKRFDFADV
jgi:hypothetical protein